MTLKRTDMPNPMVAKTVEQYVTLVKDASLRSIQKGYPTRLLDWTTNRLVGLYFSIKRHKGKQDSQVGILDPAAWNLHFYQQDFTWAVIGANSDEETQVFHELVSLTSELKRKYSEIP